MTTSSAAPTAPPPTTAAAAATSADQVSAAACIERGTVWLLRLFDVAEAIDLERARALGDARAARRGEAAIRDPEKAGTGGVVLSSSPVDLETGAVEVEGLAFQTAVRLFDFGVVSVRLSVALAPGTRCAELLALAARLERAAAAIDAAARGVWSRVGSELAGALRAPHLRDLIEDYTLYEVTRVRGVAEAAAALAAIDPARLLLAEPTRPLAPEIERNYVGRAVHYYADDAAVVGWNAALVLDPEGARDQLEVLELVTARLLELRYYDELLGRELDRLYTMASTARRASALFRSPFVRVARRAATLYVEMTELYDRAEGAITLVGDTYTVGLYREAVARFRLAEISAGVRDKLGTLARVSEVFEAEIGHRRAVLLESTVVALIVLEVVLGLLRH